MKKITLKAGLLFAIGFMSVTTYAQNFPKTFKQATGQHSQPCGTTEYQQKLQQKSGQLSAQEFENWISNKIAAKKLARLANDADDQTYNIPIVVHVVHNGDAVGVNENISETQVLSQIEVLQQDFNRMANTPGYNNNPVGAAINVNFCLAKRTPDGQNTTGIVRHNIEHNGGWSMEDANQILKPATQWDPEQYLNIWVVDRVYIEISGFEAELGGYATFPMQSGLEGLDDAMPTIAIEDGVVIGHRYFGSREIFTEGSYDETQTKDRGRTATHEIGHYLGLRHIWGDGGCDVDDFCEDTPVAGQANSECIEGTDTCEDNIGLDMIENYMDYTPDACMNIFTQDQKARMVAVLENSPRRVNLLTSEACTPATVYENDGALYIEQINLAECSNAFAPQLKLVNNGTSTLTSATIAYNISGENNGTYEWTGSLEPQQSATINLTGLTAASGTKLFNVSLSNVNGGIDGYADNDTKSTGFKIVNNITTTDVVVTIQLDSYGSETFWGIVDSNNELVTLGGPYEDAPGFEDLGELITETVSLESGECYSFVIYDLASDGMCCEYGEGYYTLADSNGNVFATGGAFEGLFEMVNFGVNIALDTKNQSIAGKNDIVLYPNPANSSINIATPQNGLLPEGYTIYNNLGQVMAQGKINSYTQEVNVSSLAHGVYFIKLSGTTAKTLQFVKN